MVGGAGQAVGGGPGEGCRGGIRRMPPGNTGKATRCVVTTGGQPAGGSAPRVSSPRSYVRNFTWLVVGRLFRLGLGLTVGAWVARYLAPAEFGELSYMLSMVALLSALAGAGLDGLIVRELVDRDRDEGETLGTAFGLRVGSGLVLYAGLLAWWWLLNGGGAGFWMIALLGAEIVLQAGNVFDLHFQARSANQWTVLAGTLSLVFASALRVALIVGGAPVVYFAVAVMLEGALLAGFLTLFYVRKEPEPARWRFRLVRARALVSESWPMIISAVAVAGCMRVDQVMLKMLAGEASVGVYAAAVRLGEVWYFVPVFLGTALYPWILEGRAQGPDVYRRRLVRFYACMFWSSLLLAAACWVFAAPVVALLFGPDYFGAVDPLRIHVVGGVFLAVGVAAGKWYVTEGHTVGVMRKALLGLVVNLVGNAMLIPRHGISGAAAAAAAGHFAANILYDLLDPRVRPQLALKLRALAPWSLRQP